VLNRKGKGDLAELRVATDLVSRGYKVAFPYGEDWNYDLIVCRRGRLERVQVKYCRSDGRRIVVRPRSASLTNGQVRKVKCYTAEMIDWLAVFDATSDGIYYIPADELGEGMYHLTLRLRHALNGQVRGTRDAANYRAI
jgi:PD-(D/E)XK endonuclease